MHCVSNVIVHTNKLHFLTYKQHRYTIINFIVFRNNAVPTIAQLLLTLRYFATGSYLKAAGDFVGVSRSSASRFIKGCSEAISNVRPIYIQFPQDLAPLKEGFFNLARFPRVIGAIDVPMLRCHQVSTSL